ncbi:tautomerase family protein [Hydromonas duriensis]|uniref:Tautomerase-like protein n=1 Tax=Hydromonas duriensis TaxID=1527608 RepID=A0A4R6Y6Q6_9BURK|nr:tautomerase family protein [Hydromonas duriensis]TDR30915.1 tautomerase-like protein [Hydromonas duriensis]
MSQIKIYGLTERLTPLRQQLSDVIHGCVVDVLRLPNDKRAHRFIGLDKKDFFYPEGRSEAYTIIEILMISGRSQETRKALIRRLFDEIEARVGIRQYDLEICIIESPAENWGFRGMHGDEVKLNYDINI